MGAEGDRACAALDERWARTLPARALRDVVICGVLGGLMDLWTRRRVRGRAHLGRVSGPVILVATHASHMDTPVILRALPAARRRRTVVAAAADYFYRRRRVAVAVSLAFATVPVRRDGHGLDPESSAHLDGLIGDGFSLVIFAEGTRSRDGSVGRLRSGAAVLAERHGLPLVPVYVSGTHTVMPPGARWMRGFPAPGRRRPIEVTFAAPIRRRPDEPRREVMERVRLSFSEAGAETTPPATPVAEQRSTSGRWGREAAAERVR